MSPEDTKERLDNTKQQARDRAEDAKVYIKLFQRKKVWPARFIRVTNLLGFLIPILLGLMAGASFISDHAQEVIKNIAYVVAAVQLIMAYLVFRLDYERNVGAYDQLIEAFTKERQSFLLINQSSEPNPGILHHIFRIEAERYHVSLEGSMRYATLEEFETFSADLKVSPK